MASEFRVRKIDHIELMVPDRAEAAAWYERTLGLMTDEELAKWAHGGGPLMIAPEDEDDGVIALFEGEPRGKRPAEGIHRIAFGVDGKGFLRFLEHVKQNPVHDEEGHEIRSLSPVDYDSDFSVYFCDPWGTRLEVTTQDADIVRKGLKN